MLSLKEIRGITLKEKVHYVWNNGMYYNSQWEGNYKINLYWMGSYYAQVWLDNNSNQIRGIVVNTSFE